MIYIGDVTTKIQRLEAKLAQSDHPKPFSHSPALFLTDIHSAFDPVSYVSPFLDRAML